MYFRANVTKMKSKKNWTESIFDSEIADLILRLEPTDVKRFNAFQDRFGSQLLNVIPGKNLRLKPSNQQLRIAIGLRLGSIICERHKCVCGKDVTEYLLFKFRFWFCFRDTTPLQGRSEATRRFDARSTGCW